MRLCLTRGDIRPPARRQLKLSACLSIVRPSHEMNHSNSPMAHDRLRRHFGEGDCDGAAVAAPACVDCRCHCCRLVGRANCYVPSLCFLYSVSL